MTTGDWNCPNCDCDLTIYYFPDGLICPECGEAVSKPDEEGKAGGEMSKLAICNKRKTCGAAKWGCFASEPHERTSVCSHKRACDKTPGMRRCVPVKAKKGGKG